MYCECIYLLRGLYVMIIVYEYIYYKQNKLSETEFKYMVKLYE